MTPQRLDQNSTTTEVTSMERTFIIRSLVLQWLLVKQYKLIYLHFY
jgi:hypothetical protein